MHVKTSENATVSAIYTPFRLNFDFFNVHSFFYTLGYMLCIEIYVRLTGSTRRRYNFFKKSSSVEKKEDRSGEREGRRGGERRWKEEYFSFPYGCEPDPPLPAIYSAI